jgi:hypothetical protein
MSIWYCRQAIVLADIVFFGSGLEALLVGYMALSSTLNFSKLQVLLVYPVPKAQRRIALHVSLFVTPI